MKGFFCKFTTNLITFLLEMKKLAVIIVVVFGFIILSSCRGSKNCPAYGKANSEQVKTNS
jgi:hypothetical protein